MSDGTRGPVESTSLSTGAIELDSISKSYGPTHAVRDVSMSVDRGEFAVLVGPSGSGKSTLLNLIAALEEPDRGTISVDGHQVAPHGRHLSQYRRTTIGLVFQLHNLLPRLSARRNIEVAMLGTHRNRREQDEVADDLLERLALSHRAGERPPTLSGGERQRVAIARALANEPSVILADEPTGSLDDTSVGLVLDLLLERTRRGATVLAVSHDARLNERADRLIPFADGTVTAAVVRP